MGKPTRALAVVMQRRAIANRWQSEVWEPWSALPGDAFQGSPRLLVDEAGVQQWLHPGFELVLHRDEAEGYYLNVSAGSPKIFVLWSLRDADGAAAAGVPLQVTASYHEASRWMDGGHSVDSVAMPAEMVPWLTEFMMAHYRPEPRRRIKPRSFLHPKDRMGG